MLEVMIDRPHDLRDNKAWYCSLGLNPTCSQGQQSMVLLAWLESHMLTGTTKQAIARLA